MKMLILTNAQREVMAKANAMTPDRQLAPVPLPDGRWALNADMLDDPGTWGRHLGELTGHVEATKSKLAIEELDLERDFYRGGDDLAVQAEITAKYQVERARIEAKLAAADGKLEALEESQVG